MTVKGYNRNEEIKNKLYLLQSIELTPTNDKFTNIPTNLLKILSGSVNLE